MMNTWEDLPMSAFEETDEVRLEEIPTQEDFERFQETNSKGILCVAESTAGEGTGATLASETYRFAKWVRKNRPAMVIDVVNGIGIRELRSGDYWFPLVFLASDIALPIYLNLVANYIYEVARGALAHDRQNVHLEAMYKDGETGTTKKFVYRGPVAGLEASMKKIDLNKLLG